MKRMNPALSRRLTAAKNTRYICGKGMEWWQNFLKEAKNVRHGKIYRSIYSMKSWQQNTMQQQRN